MFMKAGIFILQITNIFAYSHQKPLAVKIWSEGCKRNSLALNDCNWCKCDSKQKYQCKARVCEEIDMFGHFQDAIQRIDVGMEGHGSWRSLPTPCTPGVHYRRGDVLCICDEDGNWPNPVCRDLFRVLYTLEGVLQTSVINQTCTPKKLYLVGCNVCICSSVGYLDSELCTKKECQDDDPVLQQNQPIPNSLSKIPDQESWAVYASCDPHYRYNLGCRSCSCLKNNRLLCNNCSESQTLSNIPQPIIRKQKGKKYKVKIDKRKKKKGKGAYSTCKDKGISKEFEVDCNLCFCDINSNLICTTRDCIDVPVQDNEVNIKLSKIKKHIKPPIVKKSTRPALDELCTPGTMYKKECNICICIKEKNVKMFDCSLKICSKKKTAIELEQDNCVVGKVYKMSCHLCYCYTINRVKHQICQDNPECEGNSKPGLSKGYCQPLKYFKKDCNKCRCLSDGKTSICSSKICSIRSSEPLTVDLMPVQMMTSETCPEGYSYQLECNVCFCLANGNAICTTNDCSGEDREI